MPLAPLAGLSDLVLLIVRVVLGIVMVYYGWPTVKDPAKNARDFDGTGFRPGWLWGGIVLATEFGFEMLVGFVVKAAKWRTPFTDDSYDLQLAALALVLVTFGPGAISPDAALFGA